MKIFAPIIVNVFLWSVISYSQVLVVTHAYNRPDFIEIQHRTFKKFLKDDYEFIVFNDAPQEPIARLIESTCKKLNIECIRIPQSIHSKPYLPKRPDEDSNHPCKRCAHVIQYSLDTLGFNHNDLFAIIDSDMFLTEPFSIREYMHNYVLAGVPQNRSNGSLAVDYIWNGLVFFDMPALPDKKTINFNCGYVEGAPTDVGGHTYYYLKAHPSLAFKDIDVLHLEDLFCDSCKKNNIPCSHNNDMLNKNISNPAMIWLAQQGLDSSEFLLNKIFLHYRSGTNWNYKSESYHKHKTAILQKFIAKILA